MDNTLDAAESGSPDLPFRYQHALRSVYDTYARFLRQPILHVPRIWPAYSHDQLGEPTVADAICDRLLHNAHRIVLQGESRRKPITQS